MSYTQELLSKADEIIPKVKLDDFENDLNPKIMIDVRQIEELKASGSIKGSINVPKGVLNLNLIMMMRFPLRLPFMYFVQLGSDQLLLGIT